MTEPLNSGQPTPVRVGCFGCLLWVVWAGVWALVALLPLTVTDDLLGPVLHAHWPIFPAEVAPLGPGAQVASAREDQTVHVQPGSRMTLSADQVDGSIQFDTFQPESRCFTRDSDGPWNALPTLVIPVVQPSSSGDSPDLDPVQLYSFRATTGDLTVRCLGSQVLDLKREDPGVQRRLGLAMGAAKIIWLVTVTVILWGPVALVSRRRRRRAAGDLDPGGSLPPPYGTSGNPPPYGTPGSNLPPPYQTPGTDRPPPYGTPDDR